MGKQRKIKFGWIDSSFGKKNRHKKMFYLNSSLFSVFAEKNLKYKKSNFWSLINKIVTKRFKMHSVLLLGIKFASWYTFDIFHLLSTIRLRKKERGEEIQPFLGAYHDILQACNFLLPFIDRLQYLTTS